MLLPQARWLVCLLLCAVWGPAAAQVEDGAQNFKKVSSYENIKLVGSGESKAYLKRFQEDDSRFVRADVGPGLLNYTLDFDISEVRIDFYTRQESLDRSSWLLKLALGTSGDSWATVGQVGSTNDVGRAVQSQSSSQTSQGSQAEGSVSGTDISWSVSTEPIDGWLSGSVTLDALGINTVGKVKGCSERFSLQILGQGKGIQDDFQIGKISLTPVTSDSRDRCSANAPSCPTPVSGECNSNKIAPKSQQTFWYDGATSTDSLYSSTNVRVVGDLPEGLDSGTDAFAQSDASSQGSMTYRFDQGGMVQMAVTILVSPARTPTSGYVSVTPRVDLGCNTVETSPKPLSGYKRSDRLGTDWIIYELVFALGPLPQLGCQLPEYAVLTFDIEPDFEIRIAAVRIAGTGRPARGALTEVASISDTPQKDGGILSNMLFVYIAAGVGGLIVLFLLVLVWYCLGRPCCCGGARQGQPGTLMDKGGSLPPGQRSGANGHVMIAVDSIYPSDMPPSYDDDSRFSPDKYSAHGGAHSVHKASRDIGAYSARHGGAHNGHHPGGEPVVDLSVPGGGYQPVRTDGEGIFALSAPRHGQDIFDTWQHAGMGYVSGDEVDMSGPLDTQAPSFTANPPISSTGNTSPSQESSVLGVTAQLGMRLNELRGMQSDHERIARGERARSLGDGTTSDPETTASAPTAPEPLGVTYGKKIGVGGFGAVYEGKWSNKQVAVKVIKMPQTDKPGEEKAKMGFMEYAISGILVHDNIVQTYQADIRPIFLNDDGGASEGQKGKSGWTGLGDFLSNDAVSAQLQRSMRIQEWELRIVMEYCDRGNLKEAIRNGTLQRDGTACALDVALLGLDVAKGCQAIHHHNVIHGDLKPHNVLLTVAPADERGWIGKIADFGLSVKIKRGEQHVSGIQHGTEGYVAPEVLQTRRMVKASDVYSFGILMWELWHARLYYEEHRNAVKRMRRPNLEFRPTFERYCPEEWVNLAKLCWSLKPEERPDFDRVVKMMAMIVDGLREKVNSRGVIPRPDPAHLNLL